VSNQTLPVVPHARGDWRGRLLLLACRLLGFHAKSMHIVSKSRGSLEGVIIGRDDPALYAVVSAVITQYQEIQTRRFLDAILSAPPVEDSLSDENEDLMLPPEPGETIH
jgi:hypothetical protein